MLPQARCCESLRRRQAVPCRRFCPLCETVKPLSEVQEEEDGAAVPSKCQGWFGRDSWCRSVFRAPGTCQQCLQTVFPEHMLLLLPSEEDLDASEARRSLLPASCCPILPSFLVPARTCLRFAWRALLSVNLALVVHSARSAF